MVVIKLCSAIESSSKDTLSRKQKISRNQSPCASTGDAIVSPVEANRVKRGQRPHRSSAGHFGPAYSPDFVLGTAAWLGHLRARAASFQRCAANSAGLFVPSTTPARPAWLNQGQVGVSNNNRRAKYYELTPAGKKQLAAETDHWQEMTPAVSQILESV